MRILNQMEGSELRLLKRYIALLGLVVVTAFVSVTSAHAATYFYHNDHLGTPQALTDKDQKVIWQAEYDPFGRATETVAEVEQNLRFPGQYLDRETGLHYNYYRTYNPGIGRYLESDPIGLGGGINTYGYAYQSPLLYTDPTGELAFIPILVGIGVGYLYENVVADYRDKNCTCEGTNFGASGNAAIGGVIGATGPFAKKPRAGVAGGGYAGDRTSIVSKVNHTAARNGLYSIKTRNAITTAARKVPYVGIALASYEAYDAFTCN